MSIGMMIFLFSIIAFFGAGGFLLAVISLKKLEKSFSKIEKRKKDDISVIETFDNLSRNIEKFEAVAMGFDMITTAAQIMGASAVKAYKIAKK